MAIETVYAASSVSGSALNPDLALGAPNGTWAGVTNANTSWTHRWAMGLPQNTELETKGQTFQILVRKGSNSNNPTVSFNVYINGSLAAQNSPISIASTSGEPLVVSYTPSAPTTVQSIEIEVIASASGGSPSTRNSIEIDAITAELDTRTPGIPPVIVGETSYVGPVGEPITLDYSGSYDPDGTIVNYEWFYSSGNNDVPPPTGAGPIWTFTPLTGGDYVIALFATDNSGKKNNILVTITAQETSPVGIRYLFDGSVLIPLGVTVVRTA